MGRNYFYQKRKVIILGVIFIILIGIVICKLCYITLFQSEYYEMVSEELHERERDIKAKRGKILDRNGQIIADNTAVCSISVIHNQIKNRDDVIKVLCKELHLSEEFVTKRVDKFSAREIIRKNVSKETGDRIRRYHLAGIKVDEDYKRYYPYGELASKVLGFTGGDNQGILGLEIKYNEYLTGKNGQIRTMTDARGIEQNDLGERRVEAIPGNDFYTTIDLDIQKYATQLANQVMETKDADGVSIILMDIRNGEILSMVDVPEYNLNEPFELTKTFENRLYEIQKEKQEMDGIIPGEKEKNAWKQELQNQMWRNFCVHDTYEPGSIFKIITASAGLESGAVRITDQFYCSGFIVVDDRRIRCAKVQGHGAQDFATGFMNSCNPVFISVGLRIGVEKYFSYLQKYLIREKTGIDLPGEAVSILHQQDSVGNVELATISFGQCFQITPIRLMTTVAMLIRDGEVIVPHFGKRIENVEKNYVEEFVYPTETVQINEETSKNIRDMMELVVEKGGGKNAYIEGYKIGGKTATSQTFPRSAGKYIASFLGIYPADDPYIMGMVIIRNPQGQYYGGQIAAPVLRQLFENILPYLKKKGYN